MSEYQDLYDTIQTLSSKSAKFRRVILHTHSPHSHDFGCSKACDRSLNDPQQYLKVGGEELFIKHLSGNYDIVAITDHMGTSYGCRLAKVAYEGHENICILPGVELCLRLAPPLHELKLHVLAIFPETKSEAELERIFPPNFPPDHKRKGQEEIDLNDKHLSYKSLPDFIRHIESCDGICIAAHIDNNNGVRYLFRQTGRSTLELFNEDGNIRLDQEKGLSEKFKDFLIEARFHGIEVSKPGDRKHYSWENDVDGKKFRVPVFLTSDSHDIETLQSTSRITYIKTTELSWKGLAEAIKFPETRIRFSEDRVPPPHILGIEIISPNNNGFFPRLNIGFAENLNCIIGPRGSGKSTIVDAIRYVFGYNRSLNELDSKDLVQAIQNRQATNLIESRIRILYRLTDGSVHTLEATFDPKSDYVTRVYSLDGTQIRVNDIGSSGNYPVRLFGWSEIETLGRNPERQLELLDNFIEGLTEYKGKKRTIRSRLSQNRGLILAKLEELQEIIERDNQVIKRYREYQQEFEKLNTPEVQLLFENLDREREHLRFVERTIQGTEEFKQSAENLSISEFLELEQDAMKDDVLLGWWSTFNDETGFNNSRGDFEILLKSLNSSVDQLLSQMRALMKKTQHNIDLIEAQIRSKVSADPSKQILTELRSQAKSRLDGVQSLRVEYEEAYEEFEKLLRDRSQLLVDLLKTHRIISILRLHKKREIENRLNEFQTVEMQISLELTSNGNKKYLEDYLAESSGLSNAKRNFKANRWPQILAYKFDPIGLANILLKRRDKTIIGELTIDGKSYQIEQGDSKNIASHHYPYSKDDSADIEIVERSKLEYLLEMQELEWDDRERILRNDRPVDTSSPGQRSSAMLPLIALAEKIPLIIDQPEDNLDNRLVGKVLVEILAKLKERRQIIVSTHNPNIVVLGDSEQVIVLDAISDKEGCVEHQASIDDPIVVKNVIELMEGGKDAFETRSKRYQGRN